jgi:alpha-tubulin suppressor-like RCC1 family protein
MRNRRILLTVLLSTVSVFSSILSASATMLLPDDPSISHPAIALNMSQGSVAPMVAAGAKHLVGLKSDGTVVAVGGNSLGQCDVGDWTDIVQVSAGYYYTVGLRSDGTVVAVGSNSHGQSNLGRWTDIIQIAAGPNHVVGLKSDGTVVVKGGSEYGQWSSAIHDWTDITQVAAGSLHTVGLKSDGTVVTVGCVNGNDRGQCNVSNWTDIVQVTASQVGGSTFGLRSDGTVVAVGNNEYGQCDVGGWTDIVQVTTYWWTHTIGLKNDGTVITTTPLPTAVDVNNWNDIIQVSGGRNDIAGLKSDGTVVSTGPDFPLGEWNLGIITEHTLIVSSTVGGVVTTPGEKSFNYTAGAMIHLVAKPDAGCHFVNWTGDVGAIFNVDAATTVIAMNDNHSITANFQKNPPVLLLTLGTIGVVALVIFLFRERRATRTPRS